VNERVVLTTLAGAATATPAGETVGVSSQYTFGTVVLWGILVALGLYVLYWRLR
jgi:hypothetical protein